MGIHSVKETCFSQKYQKWICLILELNSSNILLSLSLPSNKTTFSSYHPFLLYISLFFEFEPNSHTFQITHNQGNNTKLDLCHIVFSKIKLFCLVHRFYRVDMIVTKYVGLIIVIKCNCINYISLSLSDKITLTTWHQHLSINQTFTFVFFLISSSNILSSLAQPFSILKNWYIIPLLDVSR